MSVLDWAFDPIARAERAEEVRRGAVARAQLKALRRHKRREARLRAWGWCRRNKMAVYPLGAVTSVAIGVFTVSILGGFLVVGAGLIVLEWRFSR